MTLRDPMASVTHLLTAGWAVFALLLMLRLTRPGNGRRLAVAVYGLSMVALYLASGLFHGLHYDTPDQRRVFQRLDMSAIYVLIAGTNTPVLVMLLRGAWRRNMLLVIWGLALAGVGCMWLLPKPPHEVMVALYLVLGWAGGVPVLQYYRALGWRVMNWVLVGGGLYTVGAVCEIVEWPNVAEYPVRVGFHEVMHLFDMAGTLTYFLFIVRHVIPYANRHRFGATLRGTKPARPAVAVGEYADKA